MEDKVVEAVGSAVVKVGRLADLFRSKVQVPVIARVKLVRRDADGNLLEERVVELGDGDDR